MSPLRLEDLFDAVRERLDRRVRRTLALWVGVAVAVVLLLAWALAGPEGWGQGTPAPLMLDVALAGVAVGAVVVYRRLRRGWMTEPRLAAAMDEAAELRAGTILGSLEVSRSVPPGVSRSLAAHGERGVLRRLELPEERLTGRLGERAAHWGRRARNGLVALVSLVILATVLAPERSSSAWRGLGSPLGLLVEPVLPPLDVRPGDVEILRGADVPITVEAGGRQEVTLHWQAAGDVARSRLAPVSDGTGSFTLRGVRAPVEYRIAAPDGAVSDTFRITPVDPLLVSDLSLELSFPPHTGRVPEEYRGEVPPLTLPVGTRIRIRGRASRPLQVAALELSRPDTTAPLRRGDGPGADGPDDAGPAGDTIRRGREPDPAGTTTGTDLEIDGAAFRGSWTPRRSGVYRWSFVDQGGVPAEMAPEPLELTLVPDSAPSVDITFPGRDTVLPLALRQPLAVRARDDHGLASLELVAYRVTSLGERQEPVAHSVGVSDSRGLLARPLLDVSGWDLLSGDTVRYFVRVVDNAPSPHAVESPEYVLRMPGVAELRREAQERLEEVARGMEELSEEAGEAADDTRDLQRRSAAARDRGDRRGTRSQPRTPAGAERAGFSEREDLRRSLEDQEEMESRIDSLRSELRETAEALREAGAQDPELARDLAELRELMEEVATPEMRERLRRMARELDQMDATRARQALQELSREQEEFRERMEASLERFRRAAAEQDFRATAAEAEELAREERALADAMREDERPEVRAEQQSGLERRAGEMEERMEGLERRLQELGEEEAAREVRGARRRSSESRRQMAEAAGQARQGQGAEAGERADEAAGTMEQAARELQQARERMAAEQAEALRRAMREAADDALGLARRQSEIGERMGGGSPDELAGLRGDQAAVMQGLRNMADNLAETTREAGDGGREISERMGRAMAAVERTARALENQPGATASPRSAARGAVDALNQVALMAMAGARQGGQEAQGQATGQQGVQQRLEQLARQQGQVNNRAGQIMPMQLGEGALREQLRSISRGQESVAEELGEVAREPGSRDQSLGDLEALAEEARELARELAGGRLDTETRERQERLFHRLLDAGRSLEKEELSEERESRAPGAFERAEVAPLTPESLGALRFQLPEAAVLRELTPARRQLVIEYFRRLNRLESAGSGGGEAGPDGGGRS